MMVAVAEYCRRTMDLFVAVQQKPTCPTYAYDIQYNPIPYHNGDIYRDSYIMNNLKITIVQTHLHWEDIDSNIKLFESITDKINKDTDLIVLPEMFTTGFTTKTASLATTMKGASVSWMKKKSVEKNADIVGSMIIREDKNFFNRLIWVKPSGELFFYDKKHLFRFGSEDKFFTPGSKKITVELKGWKIRPFICYDLRFPVWTRNCDNKYDIAVFVANWPATRSLHWKTLLAARAMENQAYIIGVNRTGQDGNKIKYSGDSSIIDPKGKTIFQTDCISCVHTETISPTPLLQYRKNFPAWKDADNFIFE